MPNQNFLSKITFNFIKKRFSVEGYKSFDLGSPNRILIVRQHNQFGDLLASVSLFRAVKEKYPYAHVSFIGSKENYYAVTQNKFIDDIFVFNKKKLFNPIYLINFCKFLNKSYDVVIVPATVSISFTSNFIARLSNSKIRIGARSLNGSKNEYDFLFNYRIDLDWKKHPDCHVADFVLDVVRPFGITTKEYATNIVVTEIDNEVVKVFMDNLRLDVNQSLIGFHVGAGKPNNRWAIYNFVVLIQKLMDEFNALCYVTGSSADKDEIKIIKQKFGHRIGYFINKRIPEVAGLINKSNLFITNDTGVMHVAGATITPQISIFGPTNPFNWAPLGPNKFFVRKSELISDVSVDDVLKLSRILLNRKLDGAIG